MYICILSTFALSPLFCVASMGVISGVQRENHIDVAKP